MDDRLQRYRQAGLKAVLFQLQYQQPDGSFIWEQSIRDAYHKQSYSWGIAGFAPQAHRLINWIKANTLKPEGDLVDYRGDVYKLSWLFQGVHRLGRFDLSYPVWSWLRTQQAECGGFPHFSGDKYLRALATAWTGVSALYIGEVELARRVGECCISMADQQPDPGRFYFQMTADGRLVTTEMDEGAQFIDCAKLNQPYWEASLPWMLMGRLYQVTGEERWLQQAERYFELHLTFAEDRFANVGSGKASLAASVHYINTGDLRARDAAYTFADFLVQTQYPEGGWRGETEPDELLIYLDHAAEYNIWLHELVCRLHAMA